MTSSRPALRPGVVLAAVVATAVLLASVPLLRHSAPYSAPTLVVVAVLRFGSVREAIAASLCTLPLVLAVTLWQSVSDGPPTAEIGRFVLMVVVYSAFLKTAASVERTQESLASSSDTIRRERDLLHGILATSPAGIVVAGADGTLEFANARALEILGLTLEQAIGRRFDAPECVVTDSSGNVVPKATHPFAQLRDAGEPVYGIEQVLAAPDGSRRVLSINGAPRATVNGQWSGGVFTINDVSESHEARRQLRDHEALQSRISAALPGVLFQLVRAPAGRDHFSFVGARAAEVLGVPAERLLDPTLDPWSIVSGDQVARLREVIALSAATLDPLRGEIQYRDQHGATRWAQVDARPTLEPDGRVQWNGIFTDITDRKLLEASLQQAQRLEGLGLLAGGVAHDFNNLLGVIRLSTESLQEQHTDASPPHELREIADATARASGLTRQLLLFSRPQVERLEVLDFTEVVRGSAQLFTRLMGSAIRVEADLPDNPVPVFADRTGLEQVLLNLVINARDAMPEGGELRLRLRIAGDEAIPGATARCVLEVQDTGHGMDDATRARVFEPFFTTKAEGRGTGLGMATVQRVVSQLGGLASVSSTPGCGTCVRLEIPLARSATAASGVA